MNKITQCFESAKEMIQQDVKNNVLPSLKSIPDFSTLHDFVDANEYLLGTSHDFTIEEYNEVSLRVESWIRTK
tara:strand:- start:1044 stop:1262 length:219 start_codon:yes stop_codon:yes gene_type:complete